MWRFSAGLVGALLWVLLLAPLATAAGDSNQLICSNEASAGFREYLPDCRAYELVSPVFKDGESVGAIAIAGDGAHVLGESIGSFGGTETGSNGSEGTVYELARSSSDWGLAAISPPASLFAAIAPFFAASTDLDKTLWALRRPSQSIYATNLYLREPDGAFVEVGPMVPPSAEAGPASGGYQLFEGGYVGVGASSDLSHVLFEIRATSALWPGDTTVESTAPSLYEYVGTEQKRPELVGLNAEGRLISSCGTALGSEPLDAYNAMSEDGQTVFFTALGRDQCREGVAAPEVNELYARLNQVETVGISEPNPSQCQECNTAMKASAEFQGASEDGSKVFFVTEQELLSGDTTQNLYEYDFGNRVGHKIVRASAGSSTPEVEGVARVSEDGSHVYFVAKGVLTEGPNREGHEPIAGSNNLYVFERDATYPAGRVSFIATLSSESTAELKAAIEACATSENVEECEARANSEFSRRNQADSADWRASDDRPVQATPNGQFLVFESAADVTAGDASTVSQVFEYDAQDETLIRVSVGERGYPSGTASADTHGANINAQSYSVLRPTTAETNLAVSADGSYVLFDSGGALTPGAEAAAAAGAESVYEYHSVGSIGNGDVYLISDGRNTLSSEALGLDASGGDAFFRTADPLLTQDVDTNYDIYDARVNGGFPAPVSSVGCEGEACLGGLSSAPSFGAPASSSTAGGGNLGPAAEPTPIPKAMRPASLTRLQRLAKALQACRKKPRKKRAACRARDKKRYEAKRNSTTRARGGSHAVQ